MHKPLSIIAAMAALLSLCASAVAAPLTFNFRFADPDSTAQAVGSITFEDTLLPNPGVLDVELPNPAVLALNVTVSGSANGDGTFGIEDFVGVVFDTNGGTLNFGAELVGQPTLVDPWGTPFGDGGDFNLFSGGNKRPAGARYDSAIAGPAGTNLPPQGVFYFTLGANGGNDEEMVLTAATPAGGPAPAPATLPFTPLTWLVLGGVLALAAGLGLRRRSHKT